VHVKFSACRDHGGARDARLSRRDPV